MLSSETRLDKFIDKSKMRHTKFAIYEAVNFSEIYVVIPLFLTDVGLFLA